MRWAGVHPDGALEHRDLGRVLGGRETRRQRVKVRQACQDLGRRQGLRGVQPWDVHYGFEGMFSTL